MDSAKEKLHGIFDWQEDVKNNDKSWQDYFDTCKGGNEYLIDLIKNTDGLSKLTGEDLVDACDKARKATIAHNEQIKNMSFSAKAGQAALKGLSIAGNILAMWVISRGIEIAVAALTLHRGRLIIRHSAKIDDDAFRMPAYFGKFLIRLCSNAYSLGLYLGKQALQMALFSPPMYHGTVVMRRPRL